LYQRLALLREGDSLAVNLAKRVLVGELMDDPSLPARDHHQALKGLRRVNQFSRTAKVVASAIIDFWKTEKPATLKILDLACGGGDVTVQVAMQLQQAGIRAEVHGWDRSETAIEFAREQLGGKPSTVQFAVTDALSDGAEKQFDVAFCTLFLHHLSDAEAEQLLKAMWRVSSRMILIDDLRRTRMGYALAIIGCQLLSRSPVVHVDGPLSVRSAFTESEILALSDRCELPPPEIKRHWPHRFLLKWTVREWTVQV